jgi:sugar lactone lactonase YvrE
MRKTLLALLNLFICVSATAQAPVVLQTTSAKDIIPEGIAIHEASERIFVSSINRHKIIIVKPNGNTSDFITPGQDGFMEGLGMKVDTINQLLWATSVQKEDSLYISKVHAFDLRNGKTKFSFALKDTSSHLLNDLVIAENGEIFITDTYYGGLYRIAKDRKSLQLFVKDSLLKYPNGIEQLDDDRLVVATYSNGPVIIQLKSKSVSKLKGARDVTISKGLDGLVFQKNKLYGVYNAADSQSQNAIIEYTLTESRDSIASERVMERGNKHFHDPTTAAAASGKLYVIANSYLTEYNGNKGSTRGIEDKLGPVTLLLYDIDSSADGKIKGIYGHPLEFWKRGFKLNELGVNAVFLHYKSIDSAFMSRARDEKQKIFAEFATLNGENYVEEHPEAWPIDNHGRKVSKATWFMGVCPTDSGFAKYRLKELRTLLTTYDVDGVWLDYLHWHAQFEDPEPILPETCFNESCIRAFQKYSGIKVQGKTIPEKAQFILSQHESSWRKWRAQVIADWVINFKSAINEIKKGALLGIYHCPWNDQDFSNARYRILGLDYMLLKKHADVFSPMVYHKRMGRDPQWVNQNIEWFSGQIGSAARIWPIVQAYNDPAVVPAAEFGKVLRDGLTSGLSSGVMMFTSSSVAEDSSKIRTMEQVYKE